MVKKNDELEVYIDHMLFPNIGVAYVDDSKVKIKGALKGQKVKIRISKKRSDKIEGKVLEIIEPSPLEIEKQCEHFGACGGCAYQNLSYESQLKLKESQVKEIIDEVVEDYEFLPIVESPSPINYRNKMEFSFGDIERDGELALGMHKKGSFYEVVTVNGCQIIDEDFKKVLLATLDFFKGKGVTFYKTRNHEGYLRHLVVRKAHATGEMLVNFVSTTQNEVDLTPLVESLTSLKLDGKINGILHTLNDTLSDVVKSDETRLLYGTDSITESLLGLNFKISPFSFFQTNSKGAEVLYSVVRDFAGDIKGKEIFDLYSGTGTIAQIMAPVASKVTGIEIVEEAVEAAKENAKLNGLDNCHFIAGDVLKEIENLKGNKPDVIILDPPREGIHPKAIHKIINFKCKEIVYVSCKPTSLARDLVVLQERGYKVEKVQCVDMFPYTAHVETVCLLKKK
ncbi:23S rRNA (uracil(1939)-C(5))-methyltransferase RlmD [Clostridium cylindrosporum]|uniref:23S rRNA (Uracil-5-)-methyltransferase RumA n=1 Tax=Clostridium cylindrosporum DSM 605 TaxID=1121307 RepID=A0A0J8DD24_CLOCY|nr:23S rRNA (uracil(1939)-C(5))-methyltransferase RlmD [Clostridium cylindrosporum]KMT22154.1 23S rRNA (uracil-5-)-methyltransferase RumA [Clostridium cylindrosporum DSM 605]